MPLCFIREAGSENNGDLLLVSSSCKGTCYLTNPRVLRKPLTHPWLCVPRHSLSFFKGIQRGKNIRYVYRRKNPSIWDSKE